MKDGINQDASFDYDVFVSYGPGDREWVQNELLMQLQAARLRVLLQDQSLALAMAEDDPDDDLATLGVTQSRKTLLVLTPDYLQSSTWGDLEHQMRLHLDIAGREQRLVPVLRQDCQLPLRLRYLTCVDLRTSADLRLGWYQLLRTLGGGAEQKLLPIRADWRLVHPYDTAPDFTGRVAERQFLSVWLNSGKEHLMLLRAPDGFGKSALAWHWLMHDVRPVSWPQVLWWSFSETHTGFADFLTHALAYLSDADTETLDSEQRLDLLLEELTRPGRLLVLDGFERLLRGQARLDAAFLAHPGDDASTNNDASPDDEPAGNGLDPELRECADPLVGRFLAALIGRQDLRSRVLATSRLLPRFLEDKEFPGEATLSCMDYPLGGMSRKDAAGFLLTRGVRGPRGDIESACESLGEHPLSLRLLSGLILKDLGHPGDIAAARRLTYLGDAQILRHTILERAFDTLPSGARNLLGMLACFRGAIDLESIYQLNEALHPSAIEGAVQELLTRGLAHADQLKKLLHLHPTVRTYVYNRVPTHQRAELHNLLRQRFEPPPEPAQVHTLTDLVSPLEHYFHTLWAGLFEDGLQMLQQRLEPAVRQQLHSPALCLELLQALYSSSDPQLPITDPSARQWLLEKLAQCYEACDRHHEAQQCRQQLTTAPSAVI